MKINVNDIFAQAIPFETNMIEENENISAIYNWCWSVFSHNIDYVLWGCHLCDEERNIHEDTS